MTGTRLPEESVAPPPANEPGEPGAADPHELETWLAYARREPAFLDALIARTRAEAEALERRRTLRRRGATTVLLLAAAAGALSGRDPLEPAASPVAEVAPAGPPADLPLPPPPAAPAAPPGATSPPPPESVARLASAPALPVPPAAADPAAEPISPLDRIGPGQRVERPGWTATLTSRDPARLAGTPLHPRVEVAGGRLDIDVVPGALDGLEVATRSALVTVLGTAFVVEDEPRAGSTVRVRRGLVRVRCEAADGAFLGPGEAHFCPWPDAQEFLHRSMELWESGAPAGELLAAADRGLAEPAELEVVHAELLYYRSVALVALGRRDDARRSIADSLALGSSLHRTEALELARGLGPGPGGPGGL